MTEDFEYTQVDPATVIKRFHNRDYKNVIVHAVRFTGENANDLRVFLGPRLAINMREGSPIFGLIDQRSESVIRIKKGNWVFQLESSNPNNFFVWKHKSFKKVYKPVKE